jgi:hypothetical protein
MSWNERKSVSGRSLNLRCTCARSPGPSPHTHTHTHTPVPAPPGPHEQDSPPASEGPGRPVSRSVVCKHFFSKLQALLQQTASIPSANCKHFFSFSRSVSLEAPTAILRRRAGHAAYSGRLPSLCDRSHWNLRNPSLSQCEHQGRSVDTWRRSDAPEFCRWPGLDVHASTQMQSRFPGSDPFPQIRLEG